MNQENAAVIGKYRVTAGEKLDKANKARQRATRPENRLRIEGEYVTQQQIAERIGRNADFVGKRLRELKGASGPITWARLAA